MTQITEKVNPTTLYIITEQWESEETVYTDTEVDTMMNDLVDWLVEDDTFRADYEVCHADDIDGMDEDEIDSCFRDYCVFAVEGAVDAAEYYGSESIGRLNIKVIKGVTA